MKQVVFAQSALDDLLAIYNRIADDKFSAAQPFTDRIRKKCELLGTFPELGEQREDLQPGLRETTIDAFVIFYQNLEAEVRIKRVIRGSQNVKSLFP